MTASRAALALVLAAVALVAPHGAAAGCDNVARSGRWSVIAMPDNLSAVNGAIAFGPGRDSIYAFPVTYGGGRTLERSSDGGCAWTTIASLDSVGTATDPVRLDPAYRFLSVAVAQGTTAKPRAIYALAGDDGYDVGLALPSVTLVSTDDGAHWTLHQATPAELAGDYPRCASDGIASTRLTVGIDPSTVYLRCRTEGVFGGYMVHECGDAYYVSHDAAKTWTAVRPRLRPWTQATLDNSLGCGLIHDPTPSRVAPHDVWDFDYAYPGPTRILLSHDEGKTYAPFATTTGTVTCGCGFGVVEVPGRPGHPLLGTWDWNDVYLPNAAGTLVRVGRPKPTQGVLGKIAGAAFVPDARGRPRLLVGYDTDKPVGSQAFLLDVATRRWTAVAPPPRRPSKLAAWDEYDAMPVRSVPGVPTVYFVTWDGVLVRYAG